MEQANYQIGFKEYIAITMLMIGLAVSDDTSSIMYQSMQNTAWMQPLISALFTCFPLFFLIRINLHYKDLDFAEIIQHITGKVLGTIILAILWIMLSLKIIIESAMYTNIIQTMFLSKTPQVIIYLVLLSIAGYLAFKGIVFIASISWVLFFFIKGALVVSLTIAMSFGNINFLFPFFGPGELTVIKESFFNTAIYFDFIFLAFLIPQLKQRKQFSKASWVALALLAFEIAFAFATYILLFDYPGAALLNFPFQEILRFIQLGFLTNMESFFLPFWLMAVFIRFAVYIHISILLFEKIFKVKQGFHLIPCFITLFILIGLITATPAFDLFIYKTKMLHFYSFFFIGFPFILWLVALSKGDFRLEKNNK